MNHSKKLCYLLISIIILNWTMVQAQDSGMVTDFSEDFLLGNSQSENVATAVPTIDFGLVSLGSYDEGFSHWCNVVLGPDGRYYFGLGDHNPNGVVLLNAFDPLSKTDEIRINSEDIQDLKDGKWHGRPDINPDNGDMYLLGFENGDLVYYNIYSRQVEHLGQPVPGEGFAEHTWDCQRDRLYGVGHNGNLLVYNTKNRNVVSHGYPSGGAYWDIRARLLDRKTGCLYSSDNMNNILQYNPSDSSFTILYSSLSSSMRAWTNLKEEDGSFWIFDRSGNVYTFYPEQDIVEYQGKNLGNGDYMTFIERSPGGRYLYYSPAQSGLESPIVQYDTQTNQKKIIAFVGNYYSSQYDYHIEGFYGGALSADGSCLFIVCNGMWDDHYRPAMFYIHIPVSERSEETNVETADLHPNHPEQIQLEENYPNPFNSETTIGYFLARKEKIKLSVYNLLGQEIEILVDEIQSAGKYTVHFDASKFNSGVYIYRLYTDSSFKTNKMLYVK